MARLDNLLAEIRRCDVCSAQLPLGPRPILQAHPDARVLVAGQAPGRRVHDTGIPWDDPSGVRLREWMGIEEVQFHDRRQVALVPMGFCYPGTGASGDLPPRKECSDLWHQRLLVMLPKVRLTLLLSQYAHTYYLEGRRKKTLTETVRAWREYRPTYIPLPHPSPRNNRWLKKNPWFQEDVLPYVRKRVRTLLRAS